MATESEVKIGGTYLCGTAKRIGDQQASLFNSSDLVITGDETAENFLRSYQITVKELRRRLESIGYSLPNVHSDIVDSLKKGYPLLTKDDFPQCRDFLDHGSKITIDELIKLVKNRGSLADFDFNPATQLDPKNFNKHLLEFIQGSILEFLIPSEKIWMSGFHFERLLCEAHSDDEIFEIDFTSLVRAGYYESDEQPISNEFDRQLSLFNSSYLIHLDKLTEEEGETLEFKTVESGNPSRAIAKQLPKYLIAFLNSQGGRIMFGVSDSGVVEGVSLKREDRDQLYKSITDVVSTISPPISQSSLIVSLRPIIRSGHELEDLFVVEISIPSGRPTEMYFTSSGDTWVRNGTTSSSLKGHSLFIHICSRYASADELLRVVTYRVQTAMDEIERLKLEGEKSKGEIAFKQNELTELRNNLTSTLSMLKATDLICPHCEAPIAKRDSYTRTAWFDGREHEADFEYLEYECGYATAEDLVAPVSKCSNS